MRSTTSRTGANFAALSLGALGSGELLLQCRASRIAKLVHDSTGQFCAMQVQRSSLTPPDSEQQLHSQPWSSIYACMPEATGLLLQLQVTPEVKPGAPAACTLQVGISWIGGS